MNKNIFFNKLYNNSEIKTVQMSDIKHLDDPARFSFSDEFKQLEPSFGLGQATRPVLNKDLEPVGGFLILQNLTAQGIKEVEVEIRFYESVEHERVDRLLLNVRRKLTVFHAGVLCRQAEEILQGPIGKAFKESLRSSNPDKTWQTRDYIAEFLPICPKNVDVALAANERWQSLREKGESDEADQFEKMMIDKSFHGMRRYLAKQNGQGNGKESADGEKGVPENSKPESESESDGDATGGESDIDINKPEAGSAPGEASDDEQDRPGSGDTLDYTRTTEKAPHPPELLESQHQELKTLFDKVNTALKSDRLVDINSTLDYVHRKLLQIGTISLDAEKRVNFAKKSGKILTLKSAMLLVAWEYLTAFLSF